METFVKKTKLDEPSTSRSSRSNVKCILYEAQKQTKYDGDSENVSCLNLRKLIQTEVLFTRVKLKVQILNWKKQNLEKKSWIIPESLNIINRIIFFCPGWSYLSSKSKQSCPQTPPDTNSLFIKMYTFRQVLTWFPTKLLLWYAWCFTFTSWSWFSIAVCILPMFLVKFRSVRIFLQQNPVQEKDMLL